MVQGTKGSFSVPTETVPFYVCTWLAVWLPKEPKEEVGQDMFLKYGGVWFAVLPNEEEEKTQKAGVNFSGDVRSEYFRNSLTHHLVTEHGIVVNNDPTSLRKNKVMASLLHNEDV